MLTKRTDLAVEAKEIWEESAAEQSKLEGVEASDHEMQGIKITTVKVLDERGEKAIGKPRGTYVTISLESFEIGDDTKLHAAAEVLKDEIKALAGLKSGDSVLLAGLGNGAITPDAIGPKTVKSTVVTRHLQERMPEYFGQYRPVAALETGVLGTTGIESADIIRAVVDKARPNCVIAVDALASRKLSRVCATVQLADTGIVPGSGVGNSRSAINAETLGVPVIAIGVPTVVDVATLCSDIMEQAGMGEHEPEELSKYSGGMIVTPRDIDAKVSSLSRLVGMAVNLALQEGMTIEGINWFLGQN